MINFQNLCVSALKGVGPKLAESLRQIHIDTVLDLLFHLPLRYENRTRITPLNAIRVGDRVVIEGTIIQGHIPARGQLVCRLRDETGEIYLRFFHFTAQQRQQFTTPGVVVRCFGEVRHRYQGGGFEMIHPQYGAEGLMSDHLMPVYACGKDRIRQTTFRKLIDQALALCQAENINEEDPLAAVWPYSDHLYDALRYVHHPPENADISALLAGTHPAQQRLACEELVAHQLALIQSREYFQRQPAMVLVGEALQAKLMANLGFTLTAAQQRVLQEINGDLSRNQPMLRLLQGDVGSGKTIVAALALLQAVEQKKQAALMVPTELLAEQHAQNLQKWCEPLGVRVVCLTGSVNQKTRKSILAALKGHELDIIIGTHALFQEEVEFGDLALIVIDEQHRFGVAQRLALKQKRKQDQCQPHQLMMTATPIPRTLAMSVYADLDVSVINELPPGRQPITTLLLSNQKRDAVMERILAHCQSGQQVYWVCTLIEVSEALCAEAAEERYKSMLIALPDLKIGLIHGRLKADIKEQIMAAFKAGEIDLLIATTVIEVGVDVPNASLMIIENAERLGLAQLHQLRGRVGRGKQASFCVLLYQGPLSLIAKQRLQVMRDHQDGFYIAEQDLTIRGPGEILGIRQTGVLHLKIADIVRDRDLLPSVRAISQQIIAEHPAMIAQLMARWLPRGEQYIEV